jgi:uncharacterized protein (DUF427 family)
MQSPGHQKHPQHKVKEEHPREKVEVYLNDKKIAESTDVVKVFEDTHPPRVYIPREDLKIGLEKSAEVYDCPFKGHAQYYSLDVGNRKIDDAIWSYEEPYDEHIGIKDRVAFYSDKYPEIKIVETPLS